VKNGEGGVDEVFFLNFFALDDEVSQEGEEVQLTRAEIGVLLDKLSKGLADGFGKALESLDAEDVANELEKVRFVVLVNLAQRVLRKEESDVENSTTF